MKLKDIININFDIELQGLTDDSREVQEGFLFLAYQGINFDGKDYISQAIQNGAICILTDKLTELKVNVPIFFVDDLKSKLSEIADKFYNHPSKKLKIIGVTGTNGKTTITNLIAQSLEFLGYKCAVLGTIGNGFLGNLQSSKNTTSGAIKTQKFLNDFVLQKTDFCSIEVSSHALHQKRIDSILFQNVVFSNITQDHLDYHITIEEYFNVKKRFLTFVSNPIINIDDPNLLSLEYLNALTYSCDNQKADIYCKEYDLVNQRAVIHTPIGIFHTKFNLIGKFNLSNLLALVCVLYQNNFSLFDIKRAIENITPVQGRMQIVPGFVNKIVIVDYAHTPDALEKSIISLKDFNKTLLCVFGCGGNRDKTKRHKMAMIAEKYSDFVIVTSDNPRFENPCDIFQDIQVGFLYNNFKIIHDRKEAIFTALSSEYQIILISGKGHENYQEINGVSYPFSDYHVALSFLEKQ